MASAGPCLSTDSPEPAARWGRGWGGRPVSSSLHPAVTPGGLNTSAPNSVGFALWFPKAQAHNSRYRFLEPSLIKMQQNQKGGESEVAQSCPTLRPHGLWPTRLLCPWGFPGKSAAVGSHSLLQGIFPTQGWNLGLLHCRQTLYHLSHQGRKEVTLVIFE